METILTRSPDAAADYIIRGGVCAFPTETVYGLGADVFDAAAIERIFLAKQRPSANPLIAHISGLEQIDSLAQEVTPAAAVLIDRFFPGPLTLVLRRRRSVPDIACAGLDTVGIRMPAAELANRFIAACSTPLFAPSANLSGRPSPTTWQAVLEDMNGRIDCILQGEATLIGLESTVVDCSQDPPVLLRKGSVSLEELRTAVGEIRMFESGSEQPIRSPGLAYRHYSPSAKVFIWDGAPADTKAAGFIGISRPDADLAQTMVCADIAEYAHSLFEFFRQCDRSGIEVIYCESVPEDGIGAALMDRIRRAAE